MIKKNIYFKHIPLLDAVSTKSLIVDSYICSWFCTSQCENLAEEKQQKHFCLENIFKGLGSECKARDP